ncbi:hypothetical protein Tco_0967351 [Tanacetum coccineum]
MRTRSSSHLIAESSTTPKLHNRRRSKQRVEPFSLEETPVVTMANQHTMTELLRAPTEGYAEAIVVPLIPVEHFELKHSLINLVTSKQFFGFEKEDPHAHIRYFNKITSTLKYKDVPETSIKLIGNGYLRKGQKSKPKRQNRARERKECKEKPKSKPSQQSQVKSPSGSGSLPSNTIANPRGDLEAITTRSGVSYDGPTILTTYFPLPKEVEREPEATKDEVQTTNLGSTAHVQPLVVQITIPEPDVTPKPNPKPSIPYPSRLNDQKL